MARPNGVGAVVLAACLATTSGWTQSTNAPVTPSLEEVSRALGAVETVFTRFVQERHLSLFKEPLRSEGYLCSQKPGRIRWETTRPYRSILVSDGAGVAQFEWMDDQWKKLELGLADALQNVVAQIAAVMEGKYAGNQRDFSVSLTHGENGPVVTLVPQHDKMRKVMQAIEVHLAPDLKGTRRVLLRESNADLTDIHFADQVVNIPLPPGTFDRTRPLDLEQIRRAVAKERP